MIWIRDLDLKDLIAVAAFMLGFLLWGVLRVLSNIDAKLAVLVEDVVDRRHPIEDEDAVEA